MAIVRDRAEYGKLDKSLDQSNFTIVPSDTVNLPVPIDAILVGGAGNITMLMPDGTSVVMSALDAGQQVLVNQPTRIMSTGTTATLMVGIASRALR